jgi:hypothetical protein
LWLSIIVLVGCCIKRSLEHLKWWIFAISSHQNSTFCFTLTHLKTPQGDHLNSQQSTVYSLLLQWRHLYGWLVCLALIGTENGISIMDHGEWKALPLGYIFLCKELVLLHGNVPIPCNRLSLSKETYSYLGERCTLWSIV